jgi:hypothetical protein
VDDDGTFGLVSPRTTTAYVTSPGRFHNGCTDEYEFDSPQFDDGTCDKAALVNGDWSLDIDGVDGNAAWVDVDPAGIDGHSSGGTYRVIAGAQGTWNSSCDNGGFQTFFIQTKTVHGAWESNSQVTIGHIDTFQFSQGATVIAETTSRNNAIIGYVANTEAGCWAEHLHIQAWNSQAYARVFDWDGPVNDVDSTISGPCSRSGGPNDSCNANILSSERMGYVGGTNVTTAEMNNPYYSGF